ncbi:MAG: hypothetical protein Q9217_000690 [Psora testacea]
MPRGGRPHEIAAQRVGSQKISASRRDGAHPLRIDDHLDQDEEAELNEDELQQLRSFATGVFDRVICDEAQKLNSPSTRSNRLSKDVSWR